MRAEKRIETLRKSLNEEGIDGFLVENPLDIFYLTGLKLSLGSLLITKRGAFLVVDGRYYEGYAETPGLTVILLKKNVLQELITNSLDLAKLGFCSANTSYDRYLDLEKMIEGVRKSGRTISLRPCPDFLLKLRQVKDEEELEALRAAAELGSKGYDFLLKELREGVTEKELQKKLDIFWKQEGAEGFSFEPIIAFGKNSAMPHYHSGDVPLSEGETVLIDIGVALNSYLSDMTRVVFFGSPPPKMQEIYEIVKGAQEAALEACLPGVKAGEVDAAARSFIEERGYGNQFVHGLGHGVGLEIHELPVLKNKDPHKDVVLMPGMVVTIEPGIYLPGTGGVRIEDTLAVGYEGIENLTRRSKDMKIIDVC